MSAPSSSWISIARSGVSSNIAPSRCERKVTPFSSSLRSCDERHDLEAAGVGQDRLRPVHECVQAAERARSARRPAAASGDRCCRARCRRRWRAPSSGVMPFTVACVPTGMKAGVAHAPMRRRRISPRARGAVGLDQAEGERASVIDASSRRDEQQAGIAIGIEAIARRDRMRIGALHRRRARKRPTTSMNKVERGRWKLVSSRSTARKR